MRLERDRKPERWERHTCGYEKIARHQNAGRQRYALPLVSTTAEGIAIQCGSVVGPHTHERVRKSFCIHNKYFN